MYQVVYFIIVPCHMYQVVYFIIVPCHMYQVVYFIIVPCHMYQVVCLYLGEAGLMAAIIALNPAHVSCPVGMISDGGSTKLFSFLSSRVYTYGINVFTCPAAQSRDVPEDSSANETNELDNELI